MTILGQGGAGQRRGGMSLTELLVAMLIGAIVIMLAISGYLMITRALDRQVSTTEGLEAANRAMDWMRADLQSALPGENDSPCAFSLSTADRGDSRLWEFRFCSRKTVEPAMREPWVDEVWEVRYWTEKESRGTYALYRSEQITGSWDEGTASASTNLLAGKMESILCMVEFKGRWLTEWPDPQSEPGRPPALIRLVVHLTSQEDDQEPVQTDLFVPSSLTWQAPQP